MSRDSFIDISELAVINPIPGYRERERGIKPHIRAWLLRLYPWLPVPERVHWWMGEQIMRILPYPPVVGGILADAVYPAWDDLHPRIEEAVQEAYAHKDGTP